MLKLKQLAPAAVICALVTGPALASLPGGEAARTAEGGAHSTPLASLLPPPSIPTGLSGTGGSGAQAGGHVETAHHVHRRRYRRYKRRHYRHGRYRPYRYGYRRHRPRCVTRIVRYTPRGKVVRVIRGCGPRYRYGYRAGF